MQLNTMIYGAILFGVAATVQAQSGYQPQPDLSNYATKPDVQAATVQITTATTAGDGSFNGTWAQPFAANPSLTIAAIPMAGTAPYLCSIGSSTTTTFSGQCWQVTATTLGSTVTSVLGTTISPIRNAAAGLTVQVAGRQ